MQSTKVNMNLRQKEESAQRKLNDNLSTFIIFFLTDSKIH